MKTNTRLLFKFLLRRCQIDCLFDIGSCDGYESYLFRQILPTARVVAFEANPVLYKKMKASPTLVESNIEIMPYAVSNQNGVARFHVPDLDYDDQHVKNPGTGSLLVHENLKIREAVDVETCRIDEFFKANCPDSRRVALWIDAEGFEYFVLEGASGIKDRVKVVHVETACTPMRLGQKVYADVEKLMQTMGFIAIGTNMSAASVWGDVVFVQRSALAGLGFRFYVCQAGGWLSYWLGANRVGGFLKNHCNPLYRAASWLYLKLFA